MEIDDETMEGKPDNINTYNRIGKLLGKMIIITNLKILQKEKRIKPSMIQISPNTVWNLVIKLSILNYRMSVGVLMPTFTLIIKKFR